MNRNLAVRTLLLALLLAVVLAAPRAAVPSAAAAAPQGIAPGLCYRVYAPIVVRGGPASAALAQVPAAVSALNAPCEGFPDFNGDGFADLAIGVPDKEVFDGVINQTDAGIVQVIYGSGSGLSATLDPAPVEDQIWHRALGGVAALADDAYGATLAMGDFNRDGYDDLAVGIPGARISGHSNAGAVQVIYGSPTGLSPAGIQEWSRAHASIAATPAAGDEFGKALAAGDFDDDGFDDLAIGVPDAFVGGDANAGAVHILYGRNSGLAGLGSEVLTQDIPGFLASPAEANDRFGFALAAGDFNGDGIDDLAVGTPYEDNGAAYTDAGAVQVFFGQSGNTGDWGIIRLGSVSNPQHWTSDTNAYVEGAMEANDAFGYSLAAGDFNGDGYDDLAVGIPFEVHGSGGSAMANGGAINIFQGAASGLIATAAYPARLWHQDSTGMDDQVYANELFGWSLAAADFDNDGYADLAIGVPGNQVLTVPIGAVHLMYGTAIGLTAANDDLVYDPINPASLDFYGWTVAAGDFNGDGFIDLAVGAYGDDPLDVAANSPGSVFVHYSDGAGVSQTVHQNWYPGHNGLRGTPATNDFFGAALPGSPARP